MLVGGIAANQQNCRSGCNLAQASGFALLTGQRPDKGCVISRPIMIDVVGTQHCARKFLQQVIFFVRGAVATDHADG